MKICELCGKTSNEGRITKLYGKMLCSKHRTQLWRHGQADNSRTIYTKNEIIIDGDMARISLYDKKCQKIAEAIIDSDDVSRCEPIKWYRRKARNTSYAMGTINGEKVFLHRFIMNYYGSDDIDHKNRNGLDNRKTNLRICSHSQNMLNQDVIGYTETPSGKFVPRLTLNYQEMYLGTFDSPEEALQARKEYLQKAA
jgi:hypothetical protein